MTSPLIPDKGPDTKAYIAEVSNRAPTIAEVMEAAVNHKTRAEMHGEIASLRKELEEANADCKRANELINAAIDDYNEARNKALDDAAEAVGKHNCSGREWSPDSFWGQVTNEAVSRIRKLKDKQP